MEQPTFNQAQMMVLDAMAGLKTKEDVEALLKVVKERFGSLAEQQKDASSEKI